MDGDSGGARDRHNYQHRPFRILLVCEANVCRSPMAEYLLRRSLAAQGVHASAFELVSAGTHADDGATMDPRTVEQLARLNVSPNGFRSHTLTDKDLDDADLILTATRAQRSMLLERLPTALRRSFTMLEFAQTARQVRSRWPNIRKPQELVRLTAAARGSVPVPEYDVADPVGGSVKVHRRNAVQGAGWAGLPVRARRGHAVPRLRRRRTEHRRVRPLYHLRTDQPVHPARRSGSPGAHSATTSAAGPSRTRCPPSRSSTPFTSSARTNK